MNRGLLITISGAGGAGKGTIIREFIKRNPEFELSISATSRKIRPDDIEGQTYYFKTKEEFEKMIENGDLLEWVEFCGNYYGTPKSNIKEKLDNGKSIILELEVEGALRVKKMFPESILIFINTENSNMLRKRLAGRGTDEDRVNVRMKKAIQEIEEAYSYEYLVVNDELEKAVSKVETIIKAESLKVSRNKEQLDNFFVD